MRSTRHSNSVSMTQNWIMLSSVLSAVIALGTFFLIRYFFPTFSSITWIAGALSVLSYLCLTLLFSRYIIRPLQSGIDEIGQLTLSIPLVASKKYIEAREQCEKIDEVQSDPAIVKLKQALCDLASMLEALESKVSQRNKAVFRAHQALKSERDFITQLVDTAQMIVMTSDDQHIIQLFNHYGEQLTGFSRDEVEGSDVARFFPPGHWSETDHILKELLLGNIQIAQQEAELVDKAGHLKQISWFHSRVERNNETTLILSVGLDNTQTRAAEKRIVWMAEHDPLTDLCNRRKFTEEFEKSLQTAIRYQHNNTLLLLDLDRFKDINDTSGHRAGDEALKLVAKTLNRITRFTDFVARLSGDEFAIIMPESDEAGAITLSKKILAELSTIHLNYASVRHTISASIGIVNYPLQDATTNELIGFADLAMYRAKANGKGRYHVFSLDDQSREQLQKRVYWKQKIEEALENHLFVLYFQPILNLNDNNIQHYEVLVRMRDPATQEITLPGKFIEIAEEVGLIQSIDHYVLHHSIKKLGELQKQGSKVEFAINLSGAVVDTPVLLPYLKKLIKRFDVDPTALIFEVTETVAVSNLYQAKLMMTAIKALGCRFSLDDFGVGFASFNYMRELPIDIIKIDGIFIQNLDINKDDQLFVKALIDVAKGLGRQTIAEYVENEAILHILQRYGVDFAQGFYIGKPQQDLLPESD